MYKLGGFRKGELICIMAKSNIGKSMYDRYEVEQLDFDEVITIDYTSMTFDDTEGAEQRDLALSDMLHDTSFSIDDTLDLADVLSQ